MDTSTVFPIPLTSAADLAPHSAGLMAAFVCCLASLDA